MTAEDDLRAKLTELLRAIQARDAEIAHWRGLVERLVNPPEGDVSPMQPPHFTDDSGAYCLWCEAEWHPRKGTTHADTCPWLAARKELGRG